MITPRDTVYPERTRSTSVGTFTRLGSLRSVLWGVLRLGTKKKMGRNPAAREIAKGKGCIQSLRFGGLVRESVLLVGCDAKTASVKQLVKRRWAGTMGVSERPNPDPKARTIGSNDLDSHRTRNKKSRTFQGSK